jgi:2,6-dihydroxypyridine 3-monooxygenase
VSDRDAGRDAGTKPGDSRVAGTGRPDRSLRVGIIGGSLAGLTVGLLLRDQGHDVEIFERATGELKSRGAGIVAVDPSFRYLTERTSSRLEDFSTAVPEVVTLDSDGRILLREQRPHRFTSWAALHGALRAVFDDSRYHMASEVLAVEALPSGTRLRFADGTDADFDLVIAADGISSSIRTQLFPEVRPQDAGYVAWRSAVPASALSAATAALVSDALIYQLLPDSHVLVYPIPGVGPGSEQGGASGARDDLINLVWYRNVAADQFDSLLTDTKGRRQHTTLQPGMVRPEHADEFRAAARAQLAPQIAEVAEVAGEPFLQVVRDIEVGHMVHGRTIILGDAAFAARPHAAAGTAKAAADAWALAEELMVGDDLDVALGRWEERQLAVGRALVARTRELGDRSQFGGGWTVGEKAYQFGLLEPGQMEIPTAEARPA